MVDEVLCSLGYGMEEYGTLLNPSMVLLLVKPPPSLAILSFKERGSYMIEVHQPQQKNIVILVLMKKK